MTSAGGDYQVKLALVVPCSTCNEPRGIQGPGLCAVCGVTLPANLVATVRSAVKSRRQAFKVRLARLRERMHSLSSRDLDFATRGTPQEDHLDNVVRPALNAQLARVDVIKELFAQNTWDPSKSETIAAFSKLVRALEDGLSAVETLCGVMPPIEVRAIHRELTRAVLHQTSAQINLALTLTASDLAAATVLQQEAEQSLSKAEEHSLRIQSFMHLIEGSPDVDPFGPDGSMNVAGLTWASVGQKSTTINGGAALVRKGFQGVPGMANLPSYQALVLLPLLAMGARVVDHEVLIRRSQQLRSVVDNADVASEWVLDADLFASRITRATERITREVERLGREWRFGLPRHHVMNSLTEIYRQLVEGPLRDLGGIAVVAGRAGRGDANGTYEQPVIDGIMAGDVITELQRLGAPCGGAIDMLYRNASAHGDIEVTPTGITATERVIQGGREISRTQESRSDAEFAEEMLKLQETLLALQVAILCWAYDRADPSVRVALESLTPNPDQAQRMISMIGGLMGMREVSTTFDGANILIRAALQEQSDERSEIGILSLLPAAFGGFPQAVQATLSINGLNDVTYQPAEFTFPGDPESPHALPMLGLTTFKWLVQSGVEWTHQDEATYVTFPLAMLHFACMRVASAEPHQPENVEAALASWGLVKARLAEFFPRIRWSELTNRAMDQLEILGASLPGIADGLRNPRKSNNMQELAQAAAATVDVMYQIQEEAKAIRDRE